MLFQQLPFVGPNSKADYFEPKGLSELLVKNLERAEAELFDQPGDLDVSKCSILVHKALVTPVGIYLMGPHIESTNRVLHQYRAFSEYFLRISFLDEDGRVVHNDKEN